MSSLYKRKFCFYKLRIKN